MIDEYGDGVPVKHEWKYGKWCQYLNPENKRLLNLDYLSALPVVKVSIHPDLVDVNTSRPVEGLFQENSFQVCSLNKLYRNSANIVKHYKDMGLSSINYKTPPRPRPSM